MKIAIIGAGNIGGNLAKQFALAGHTVVITFSRSNERLHKRAEQIGQGVTTADVATAVKTSDVVVLSTGWDAIDDALQQAGNLAGKVVIDTTNQFSSSGIPNLGMTVAAYNQARMPGAKLARMFNTLHAAYQIGVGDRLHGPVAMLYAAEDKHAAEIAERLATDAGFEPVCIGGWDMSTHIEAPDGMAFGHPYSPEVARRMVDALQSDDIDLAQKLAENTK